MAGLRGAEQVIEVADMCDANGTVQGQPGYSNPLVLPGDRSVAACSPAVNPYQPPVYALAPAQRGDQVQAGRCVVSMGREGGRLVAIDGRECENLDITQV